MRLALSINIQHNGPNVTVALRKLKPEERSLYRIQGSSGGNPNTTIVTEAGLYKLILRSDKPEARAFQDLVTGTVLPAIRKDGMYVAGEEKVATGQMSEDELTLLVMDRLRVKVDRLKQERDAAVRAEKVAVEKQDEMRTVFAKAMRIMDAKIEQLRQERDNSRVERDKAVRTPRLYGPEAGNFQILIS